VWGLQIVRILFQKYTVVKDAVPKNHQTKGDSQLIIMSNDIMINKEKEIQTIQLQKQTLMKNILFGA